MLHGAPEIINFEAARISAFNGVMAYINNQPTAGDRYGQHHSEMGLKRARNLGMLLAQLGADSEHKNINLLTLFLATFGIHPTDNRFFKNPFPGLGRSSKLASFISDHWIQGDITYGVGTPPGSVTSVVFAHDALNQAVNNINNDRPLHNGELVGSYFDKTKGARNILEMAFNSPTFKKDKIKIMEAIPKLRDYLEINETPNLLLGQLALPFSITPEPNGAPTLRKITL